MKSNKYPRVLHALACEPWCISPAMHGVLCGILGAHIRGGDDLAAARMQGAKLLAEQEEDAPEPVEYINGVAVVTVGGVLARKFSNMLNSSGVTSTDVLEGTIARLADDPAAKAIFLAIDSPGGQASGIPEAAAAVRAAAEKKPVIAYADGQMNSAAYWLASQANMILATPSGDIGCIGAYLALLDESRAYAAAGLSVEMFKDGEYKGMGYPGLPLTDAQRKMLQERVDSISAQFKNEVLANRPTVSGEVMQGQSFPAKDALAVGLIDGIAGIGEAIGAALRYSNMRLGAK